MILNAEQFDMRIKKLTQPNWPRTQNTMPAILLKTGQEVAVPILESNTLIIGKTGHGKTVFTKAMIEPILKEENEPYTVFFEMKKDFRKYLRRQDKVVSYSNRLGDYNYFKWNLIFEVRQSDDWNGMLDTILEELFRELAMDKRSIFWIEGAKGILKGFLNTILYCYTNSPSNAIWINALKTMSPVQLVEHLGKYKGNKNVLVNYLKYEETNKDSYVPSRSVSDFLTFLGIVLEQFAGNFAAPDGMDTIHNFLENQYGKRLFLIYDYEYQKTSNPFFRLILNQIIREKLSQNSDTSKKVLMVLDEVTSLGTDFGLLEAATVGRGNKLQIILSTQSIEKLYCIAPEINGEHSTMASLAGFPTNVIFQLGESKSIEAVRQLFGSQKTLPMSRYASQENQKVDMVSEQELAQLGVGECYVKIEGTLPQKIKLLRQKS